MRTVSQFFSNQLTSAIALGRSWKVYVQFDALNDLWTELDVNQLDRIGWELEKDWSVFISGDVSFRVYDSDSAIRNLIGNNLCKVKIYVNYSDYSHNDSCLVFCGYIKPSETIIENDFVTYYCQSILSYLDDSATFPFYGRRYIGEYFSGITPLRNVLQQDYELSLHCNFDDCKLFGFDRTKSNVFKAQGINPTILGDKDLVYHDESDYSYIVNLVEPYNFNNIKIHIVHISKNDTSEIKEISDLLTVHLDFTVATTNAVRIFRSISTNFDYLILVKAINGMLGAIVKVANGIPYTFNTLSANIKFESVNLSPDGEYLCGIKYYVNTQRAIVRIETGNLTIDQTTILASGWDDIDVQSADLSMVGSTYYYGFVYHLGVFTFFAIYSFVTGWSLTLVKNDLVPNSGYYKINATGRYFFLIGYVNNESHPLYYNVMTDTKTDRKSTRLNSSHTT